jgi:hypothetical protein
MITYESLKYLEYVLGNNTSKLPLHLQVALNNSFFFFWTQIQDFISNYKIMCGKFSKILTTEITS